MKRNVRKKPVLDNHRPVDETRIVTLKLTSRHNLRDEVAVRLSDVWTALTDEDIAKIAEVVGL